MNQAKKTKTRKKILTVLAFTDFSFTKSTFYSFIIVKIHHSQQVFATYLIFNDVITQLSL